jgi:PEP-CTERM motif
VVGWLIFVTITNAQCAGNQPAIQALVTVGTLSATNGWLEFMLTTNAGNFNYPVTYYLDSWRFTTPVVGVPGDYNNNGTVDAADYVLWRNGGPLQNEVADIGTVSPADYTEWRARFGNVAGAGASLGAAAVPEPASWLLAVAFGGLIGLRRSHR